MSTVKAKKSIGFFIIAAAAVVGIVSIALYGSSYNTDSKAYGFMIAAVIVAAVALVVGQVAGKGNIVNWGGVCAAALMAAGLGWSLTVMVDAIGYVISGLFQFSTLQSYITFAIVAGISWALFLIGSFTGIVKD